MIKGFFFFQGIKRFIQLVVVSEVAMAVRMVMTKCRILLQSSFLFMVWVWFWG